MKISSLTLTLFTCLSCASCSVNSTVSTPNKIDFAGQHTLEWNHKFNNDLFGGISSLYFDNKTEVFYGISDDKEKTRVYKIKMDLSEKGINNFKIDNVIYIQDPSESLDAEGIALLDNKSFFYTSERGNILRLSNINGKYIKNFDHVIPDYYKVKDNEGHRFNLGAEGLSMTPDKNYLFLAFENTLKQDGEINSAKKGSLSRILRYKWDKKAKELVLDGEFLYEIGPIPKKEIKENDKSDNGVSEVLALNENKLLIIERAGIQLNEKDWENKIKVFYVDLSNATNIKNVVAIDELDKKPVTAKKELFIDFNKVMKENPDCIEAITFGPKINGQKTLIFASDSNFNDTQANKFYLFIDKKGVLN